MLKLPDGLDGFIYKPARKPLKERSTTAEIKHREKRKIKNEIAFKSRRRNR